MVVWMYWLILAGCISNNITHTDMWKSRKRQNRKSCCNTSNGLSPYRVTSTLNTFGDVIYATKAMANAGCILLVVRSLAFNVAHGSMEQRSLQVAWWKVAPDLNYTQLAAIGSFWDWVLGLGLLWSRHTHMGTFEGNTLQWRKWATRNASDL